MGESRRRKRQDPTYGILPKQLKPFLKQVSQAFDKQINLGETEGVFIKLPPDNRGVSFLSWVGIGDFDVTGDVDAKRLVNLYQEYSAPSYIIVELPDIQEALILCREKLEKFIGE